MANGASRLFEVMKNTGESTNNTPSQLVSLTIKSVNPLILVRDDRLEIPAEFCILHKSLNIDTFRINDIVTAIVLNNGQQYFIIYNNTAEEQGANYNDLSNKPKINGVELNGNKTSDDLLIVSKSELQQIVQDMTTNINNKVTKSGDTMTGGLFMQGNLIGFGNGGNIFFKEDGYGDKFRILPDFNGAGVNNKLKVQSTTGGAGEDPQNWENLAYLNADDGDLTIKGKIKASNINTAKLYWGTSMSFTMQSGGHALVMLSNTDCLMIWMGGGVGSESITVVRLSGTEAQVNLSGTTVTVNFLDNRNFTGNTIIL